MDLEHKIQLLLTEKEEKIKVEIEAHKRIIEIDRQVKSLKRLLKEADDILSEDKVAVLPEHWEEGKVEENGQGEDVQQMQQLKNIFKVRH